jgi:hypothetical protein
MYNIYCEEEKLLEEGQKLKQKKDMVLYQEKHKKKTDSLVNNYQNRIRKFIIDVSINIIITYKIFIRWQKKIL